MTYRVVFRVTREYTVNFDATDEVHADAICEQMPVEDIERQGAGRVTEDVEILSLVPYAR